MNRVTAFTVTIIVTAFTATSASAQAPPRSYSLSTAAIAGHVARDIVRTEICGLPPVPLPFPLPRSATFVGMLLREQAMLERAMLDHGDAVICGCLAAGRATCP